MSWPATIQCPCGERELLHNEIQACYATKGDDHGK